MRKPGAAIVAAPIRLLTRIGRLDPDGKATRVLAVAAVATFVASAVVGMRPGAGVAAPAFEPAPVSASAFTAIGTAHGLTAPFTIAFDAPMDPATVAGALTVSPASAFEISWDAAGRTLTVSPVEHWQPGTLYSVVVDRTARSAEGGSLAAPVRSVALTARSGSGAMAAMAPVSMAGPAERAAAPVAATDPAADRIRLDSAVAIHLDRPVPLAAVQAALRSEPMVAGTLAAGDTAGTFTFTPVAPLAPDTVYRFSLTGLVDAAGVPFEDLPVVSVRTVAAPEVVRFGPKDDSTGVRRSATFKVRFSEPMDRARTEAAFTATAGGKHIKGKVKWTEDDTVLVFDPVKSLPYDAKVVLRIDDSAHSRFGAPIAQATKAVVRTEEKPDVPVEPIPSGGAGAVSGSWAAVEKYYLRLMNCTRTGGWVTSGGACSSPGGRDVAPLVLSSGISSRVARPYARLLATRGQCSHFIGGNPGDRLRRAGYSSYRWGENIGCRSGGARSAVLASHLFFQSEKPWNGGHYRNLMDARFTHVGIGVWVSGGRVRLVVDFYRP